MVDMYIFSDPVSSLQSPVLQKEVKKNKKNNNIFYTGFGMNVGPYMAYILFFLLYKKGVLEVQNVVFMHLQQFSSF